MLYLYQKSTPAKPSPGHTLPNQIRFLPTLISAIGLGLIAAVVWPILGYQLSQVKLVKFGGDLLLPIHYQSFASASKDPSLPETTQLDYTRASNWFANSSAFNFIPSVETSETTYQISIPSLGIDQANVSLVNEELEKNLVHYPQTALPGQNGSPVIFGHSTLPQFFDPTDYTTIFSTLPTIKPGASIFVIFAGIKYTYKVNRIYEVKPNETWVLRQEYNQKTLKLITCVPPGTKLKRLVVEAELVKV